MITADFEGKKASLYLCGAEKVPLIVLNSYSDEGEAAAAALKAVGSPECDLLLVSRLDWDRDMSPWPCLPVFAGGASYDGGADVYLRQLTEQILPWARSELPGISAYVGIAGYSLAGLFAIYSLYRCDVFDRAASISGSLWYPDFLRFVREHDFVRRPEKLYFSVGDKEAKTKNPFLKTVQENTETAAELYREKGIEVFFELNPGNHFREPELRTAKGIRSVIGSGE